MNKIWHYFVVDLNEDVIKALQTARRTKEELIAVDDDDEEEEDEEEEEDDKKVVNDMKNCFGFDVSKLILIIFWGLQLGIVVVVSEDNNYF